MRIELKRKNKAVHLEAMNEDGQVVSIDGAASVGGENLGMRPMQMVLSALGGCSSIDVINILKKQRQPLEDIQVCIDGERQKEVSPSLFEKIHVHFTLKGDLDENKVKRAISLSMDHHCSVAKTLEKTAAITYSYEIINN
jgi:putative redox protein